MKTESEKHIEQTATVFGNTVTHPDWIQQNEWRWTYEASPQEISYVDRLTVRIRHTLLAFQRLPDAQFNSGQLIATSALKHITQFIDSSAHVIHVPKERCKVYLATTDNEFHVDEACLSLVWKQTDTPQRRVVLIPAPRWGSNEQGVFFVDYFLLGLFDNGQFKAKVQNKHELDQVLNKDVITKALDPRSPPVSIENPQGLLVRAPTGVAAAIVEYEDDGSICALHFDFMGIHSSGADGEYLPDWEFKHQYDIQLKKLSKQD